MTRLARRLPVIVLLALVLAGSVGFTGYRLVGLNLRVAQEVADTRWLLAQLEVEYHRFRGTATQFILGAPGIDRGALMQRYEILWSRFPVLLHGEESASLRALADIDEAVTAAFAAVRDLEPAVLALRHGEPQQHAPFIALLDPIGERVRAIVLEAIAFDRWSGAYRRDVLQRPQLDVILSVGVFVVVTGLLFGLLWREVQRSNAEIAQRQKTEARLREALQAAEKASRTKTSFLANVSHELRTPLNAILGFAEMVRAEMFGAVEGRNREYVNDIYASAEHLHKLVDEILDLSRVEAGAMRLDETRFAPGDVLESCREMTAPQAQARGTQVVVECAPGLPELQADETKVRQVVINLLSNAIRYSHPSDRIVLSAARGDDGGIVFAVADNGPGIPPEHLGQVFEPFNRVTKDTYTRSLGHTGSGLGLAIAKTFVELHQGRIDIDSQVDVGTTVSVSFPPSRIVELPTAASA